MNKKIVIVGTAHPFRGGLASYNERMAREFRDLGHQVKIITFTTQYPNILFPGKTQYSESPAPKGIDISREVSSVNPLTWIKVGRKLKQEAPDIIIFKFWLPFMAPCFGTIARIAKRNKKTKIITIVDNMIPHERRVGDIPFIKYYAKWSDAYIAMSDSVLTDVKKFAPNAPMMLNPHPLFDNFGEKIDTAKAKELIGFSSEDKLVMFFGFIRDYKGLDILLEAWKDERLQKLPIKLVIAGEYYNNKDKYAELLDHPSAEGRVFSHDHFIADEEVKNYFSAADVVVQPYKTATQSGVTQIAYQMEVPMIVTAVGGLPELIPHGKVGMVVPPQNPKALASAIYEFYTSDQIDTYVANVKEEKKKFTWAELCNKVITLSNHKKINS